MIPLHGAALPAPPSYLRQSQRQGLDEHFAQGPAGSLWGESYSNTVVSHPLPQMMSQLSVLVGCVYLFFTQSHTHRIECGGRGRDSYRRNMLRNSPAPPSHSNRETESSPGPTGPAWPAPHHLPVFTSSLSPQPEGPPPCFSNSSGTLQRLFSLPTESSSSSTFFTPSSLCSNVTFSARLFLTSLF